MSADQRESTSNGQVIQLRATDAGTEAGLADTPPPAYVDTTNDGTIKRLPVIPVPLQRQNIRGTVEQAAGLGWHRVKYHSFRAPKYGALFLVGAARGAAVLTGRLWAWWQSLEHRILLSQAVAAGRPGYQQAMSADAAGRKVRKSRSQILASILAGVLVAGLLLAKFAPWWGWALCAVAAVAVLERHGRKPGKPLVGPAVVPPQYQPLTHDVIVSALGRLGLGEMNRALRESVPVRTIIGRDGPGWRAEVDLPPGVTAAMVMDKREEFASGLRRPTGCVWPEPSLNGHAGKLMVYISDAPMSQARQQPWPLARQGRSDVFRPLPFGTDQRGQVVPVTLIFESVLIGAIPRSGKTGAMRVIGLGAALDPNCELHVFDLKGTGDLSALEKVAHRYACGPADDDTLAACMDSLREVHRYLTARAKTIAALPSDQAPDRKVTPELAAKRSLGLRPVGVLIDELQELFESGYAREAETLLLALLKRGPAMGIFIVMATQRPDARSLPKSISANAGVRFCLRIVDEQSNNMILGAGMYAAGYRATMFTVKDKGVGWLAGQAEDPQVTRTFYMDAPAADKITARARAAREAAGALTGQAAGLDDTELRRSFAADVLSVFGTGDKLWSSTIATRLAEVLPAVYAEITPGAVSSQLRGIGVEIKNVREPGRDPNLGCERTAIEAVTRENR